MAADLKTPFMESCCDGGSCDISGVSAQSCGCDPGADHLCDRHKMEELIKERDAARANLFYRITGWAPNGMEDKMIEQRFKLVQDDSDHWYVIPVEREEEWTEFEEDEDNWDVPEWAKALNGSPSHITFSDWRQE